MKDSRKKNEKNRQNKYKLDWNNTKTAESAQEAQSECGGFKNEINYFSRKNAGISGTSVTVCDEPDDVAW